MYKQWKFLFNSTFQSNLLIMYLFKFSSLFLHGVNPDYNNSRSLTISGKILLPAQNSTRGNYKVAILKLTLY